MKVGFIRQAEEPLVTGLICFCGSEAASGVEGLYESEILRYDSVLKV